MIDFRVNLDNSTGKVTYTDLTDHLADYGLIPQGKLVVYYPDGIVQDFGYILTNSNSFTKELTVRRDITGRPMQGTYRFLYRLYNGAVLVDTFDDTISVVVPDKELTITESFDVFTPLLLVSDPNDYTVNGFAIDMIARAWSAVRGGVTYSWNGSSLAFTPAYSGTYEYTLTTTVTYVKDFVSFIDVFTGSGTGVVTKPIMIPEILALFNCLIAKIFAKDCCKDATYDLMVADYQMGQALLHNFIQNGQAGITDGQSELLDSILTIVRRWGCADDGTIADTLLSAYDWCLCPSGVSSGSERANYEAGDGCWISSDATEPGERWTFAINAGIGSFTENLADSSIFAGTVRGTSTEATYSAFGANQSFRLDIPVGNGNANADYAAALLGSTQVWSGGQDTPSDSEPIVMDEGAVQKRIAGISSGVISFVFAGVGATYPDGWMITFVMP